MASTENKLSKIIGKDGKSQIIVKLTISRSNRPCFKSGVFVEPQFFKPVRKTLKGFIYDIVPPKRSKLNFADVNTVTEAKNSLDTYTNRLLRICQVAESKNRDILTKEWIEKALIAVSNLNVDEITIGVIIERMKETSNIPKLSEKKTIFEYCEEYLKKTKYSTVREKNFRVLIRALKRYELFYQRFNDNLSFILDIDTISKDTIEDIERFLRNEHSLLEEYPNIFEQFPSTTDTKRRSPKPQPRGDNTICILLKKFRAFCNWCNSQGITTNKPFAGYNGVTTEKYGTPYYITIDERNHIADFDLSHRPKLAIQRDIFIFQCLIGCRVSDLMRLTKDSVINGVVEYIPNKTKSERPDVVRVPLNDRAKAIIERYKNEDGLLPFISSQKYNDAIKEVFTLCGITRLVTVLNPTSGKEEKQPINELASSHMARRTFIGNLYKKVKDPNLVGALSGHKDGSKAFARYRDIDDDIKKELVDLLD